MIDKRAIIDENVKMGKDVIIGPYAVIEEGVEIGSGCKIAAHGIVRKGTILGERVKIDSFAVVGGAPQDISFIEEKSSGVMIGDGTVIREGVTIHRATIEGKYTKVGKNCFLMANSHIAHDCIIGDEVKLANGVLLGGYVKIDDFVFMGGNAVVHQNLRIGEGTIVAGNARLNLDIPPFLIVSEVSDIHGLNVIGIKRRGFGQAEISDLKTCFQAVLNFPGNPYLNAQRVGEEGLIKTVLGERFLAFFETRGKKGCVQQRHIGRNE